MTLSTTRFRRTCRPRTFKVQRSKQQVPHVARPCWRAAREGLCPSDQHRRDDRRPMIFITTLCVKNFRSVPGRTMRLFKTPSRRQHSGGQTPHRRSPPRLVAHAAITLLTERTRTRGARAGSKWRQQHRHHKTATSERDNGEVPPGTHPPQTRGELAHRSRGLRTRSRNHRPSLAAPPSACVASSL